MTDKQYCEILKALILKKGSKTMKQDLKDIERIFGKIKRLTNKILKQQDDFAIPRLLIK